MSDENKAISRRVFEEIISQGNLSLADEIFASNYVDHDPANPDVSGPEGFKLLVSKYRSAFPDLRLTVNDIFAEGDEVVVRWTWSGTHEGDLEGVPPTGKKMGGEGITISRFSGGKVEEDWANWDALGLMRQLGVVPEN
jgi:steroid delta-isomerase-like uncharacterized protein